MPKNVDIDNQGLATPYSLSLSKGAGDTVVWKGTPGWRVKFGARNPFRGNNFVIGQNGQTTPVALQAGVDIGGYDYIIEKKDSKDVVDPRIEINR